MHSVASIKSGLTGIAIIAAAGVVATPAVAAKEPPVTVTKCEKSYGSIAVVEGDAQGWSKFGLGSPRELITALAIESGCFTPHSPATNQPATFLMNVIAGDKEEVDKSVDAARSLATTGLLHSGAMGSVLSRVPMGGAVLGMFGGLGGKKKTVAAGIRILSPGTGQTLVAGTGEVKKSTISFGGVTNAWTQGAEAAGYAGSKDGAMLTEAFIKAFNQVVAQGSVLSSVPQQVMASAAVASGATVAVNTSMYGTPSKTGSVVRSLRANTTLTPTGKRDGLFLEVADSFGTKGWVSVEDLK